MTATVDVLLIGGGVASASAAAELRVEGFEGSIVLVTRELDAPYHRPPVTKELLTGEAGAEDVVVHPAAWWAANGVELQTRASVTKLDVEARRATLATEEEIGFDRALVATGAMVRRLRLDGAQLDGVHYLRAPGNALKLRAEVAAAERVVVVGGSFIATEVAASLTTLGKRCTLVMQERLPLERAFGVTAGRYVADLLAREGVEVVGGTDVTTLEGESHVAGVLTASGRRLGADLVVVGAGAVPDVMLATRAGLVIGETGGIRCDTTLQTSAPGIYAAGDACEYDSVLHGRRVRIEHEEHAIAQGRTAARNLLGAEKAHDEVPYFWSQLADWARLEYVGTGGPWDEECVTGETGKGRFTIWYVRDGRIAGALTVGRPEDLDIARALIAESARAERIPETTTEARL